MLHIEGLIKHYPGFCLEASLNVAPGSVTGLIGQNGEEYASLDTSRLLKRKKESYGYMCLTDQRSYFLQNCPGLVVEKSGLDDLIMLIQGKISVYRPLDGRLRADRRGGLPPAEPGCRETRLLGGDLPFVAVRPAGRQPDDGAHDPLPPQIRQ